MEQVFTYQDLVQTSVTGPLLFDAFSVFIVYFNQKKLGWDKGTKECQAAGGLQVLVTCFQLYNLYLPSGAKPERDLCLVCSPHFTL